MKKLLILIGVMMAAGLSVPVFGQQGSGQGMMGPGHMMQGGGSDADQERIGEYKAAWEKHRKDTAELRLKVWRKRNALAMMMADPEAAKEDALRTQEELQKLRNELQKRRLAFQFDMHKKFADLAGQTGWCEPGMMGPGMMGPGMMGQGMMGPGMMGPGMMGQGMMGQGMMGSGMMGSGMMGSGMMGSGMMGPGMMGSGMMGPGMMGQGMMGSGMRCPGCGYGPGMMWQEE